MDSKRNPGSCPCTIALMHRTASFRGTHTRSHRQRGVPHLPRAVRGQPPGGGGARAVQLPSTVAGDHPSTIRPVVLSVVGDTGARMEDAAVTLRAHSRWEDRTKLLMLRLRGPPGGGTLPLTSSECLGSGSGGHAIWTTKNIRTHKKRSA